MGARNYNEELKELGLTVDDVAVMQNQMDKGTDFFDAASNLISLQIHQYEIIQRMQLKTPHISRERALGILIRKAQ